MVSLLWLGHGECASLRRSLHLMLLRSGVRSGHPRHPVPVAYNSTRRELSHAWFHPVLGPRCSGFGCSCQLPLPTIFTFGAVTTTGNYYINVASARARMPLSHATDNGKTVAATSMAGARERRLSRGW